MIQTYTFRYIYLAEIQSLRTIEKNTIFNTLEQQIYRTSFFPSFQKKKKKSLRLNRPYISILFHQLFRFIAV